jgi:hypothetical protein
MDTNQPASPEQEVRVVIREDNGAEHHHSFKTNNIKEALILLEATVWFETLYGTQRADDAQIFISNRNELKLL